MALRFLSSGNIDGEFKIEVAGPKLQLKPTTQNNASIIELGVLNAGTNAYARIDAINLNNYDTNLRFWTNAAGSTTQVERMRIATDLITFPTITELRGDIASDKFAVGNMGDASSQMMVSSRGFLTLNVSNTGSALDALERLRITATGAISVGSTGTNYGTSGQVLTSGGNSNPTWTTPTTGTITGSGTANKVTKFTGATAIGDGPITFATNDSTFAGKILVGTGATAAASLNAFTTTVSANLFSALRVIENTGASSYWDIGATNGASTILNFYHNAATTPKITFTHLGGATFAGNVGIGYTSPASILHVGSTGTNAYSTTITKGSNMKGIINTLSNNADDMVGIYFATGTTTEGTHWSGITGSRTDNASHWGTQLNFYTHANDVAALNDATQKMVIKGDGNVGIGTASPDVKLHVYNGDSGATTVGGASDELILENDTDCGLTIRSGTSSDGVISFADSGDHNIGQVYYSHGSNSMTFRTNDNTAVTIDSSQKVGIGTTSPDGKLEVAGGTTLGFRLSNAGDSSAYDQVRMTYGGYNSGAPTVTFMPLTTPGGGNVDTTFHFMNTNGLNANNNRANVNIDGILYVGSGRQSGETTLIMRNYDDSLVNAQDIQNSIRMSGRYWSGSASQLVETRINSVHQESNGNGGSALTFMTQTGGSAVVEQMRIDKVGNVGIGGAPSVNFEVNKTGARVKLIDGTNQLNMGLWDGSNYRFEGDANRPMFFTSYQGNINFGISGGTTMTIQNGKVGIAKTNPAYTLDVTGSIYCTASYVRASTAPDIWYSNNNIDTYTQTVLYMNQTNSSNNDANGYFFERGRISNSSTAEIRRWVVGARGGQKQMVLDGPGTLTVAGDLVAYGSPSDISLKENIKPIKNPLGKIKKLKGVTFDWKKSESILDIKKDYGFIAQDVQKVIPKLVRENEDGKLSMRHQGVIPILVEAMKEQQKQIDRLEEQIKKMSSKN